MPTGWASVPKHGARRAQARIPELAPRLEAVAQEHQADIMLAAHGMRDAHPGGSAGFPAQELLNTITAAVEVGAPHGAPRQAFVARQLLAACVLPCPMAGWGGP